MAKKTKKLTEDALVNEMQPQQAPVAQQATPEEVAAATNNAQPVPQQADPAAPAADPETQVDPTVDGEVPMEDEVPEDEVQVKIQIDKADLSSAISAAMQFGDVNAADPLAGEDPNLEADDTNAAVDPSQIAADNVTAAPIPGEEATTAPNQVGELSPEEQDVILEYRKFKAAQAQKLVEDTDPITGEDLSEEDPEEADLEEDSEDDIAMVPEDGIDEVSVDEEDVEDIDSEETVEDDIVASLDGEDDLLDGEVEVNEDLMDTIKDFLQDFDGDDDLPEALRDTADFLDDLLGTDEDDADDTEIEELEDAAEEMDDTVAENTIEDVDEESIEDGDEPADITEVEDTDADEIEEVEETEDITGDAAEFVENFERKYNTKKPSEIKKFNEDGIIYPAGSSRPTTPVDEAAKAPAASTPTAEPVHSYDEVDDELVDDSFEEDNLVKSYEATSLKRRQALKEYREALRESYREGRNSNRFSEALSSSARIEKSSNKKLDEKSWQANKFLDKYEESSKLDFQQLLEDGFLG